MQWLKKSGNTTINLKVKVDFTLPALSETNVVTWKCHVDDSTKSSYHMILGCYLLTKLVLNLTLSDHIIKAYDGPFKVSTTPMVDLGTYVFKLLNNEK